MSLADQVARVAAPESGNVIQLDVTTDAQRVNIPAQFGGMTVTVEFRPDSEDFSAYCAVLFGGAAVSASDDQDSSVTTENITVNAATAKRFYPGVEYSFEMPEQVSGNSPSDMSFHGSAAGKLIIALG